MAAGSEPRSWDDYPPILDTVMVAEILKMSIETVRRKAHAGQIPARQVPGGRAYLFDKDDLIAWFKALPVHAPDTTRR